MKRENAETYVSRIENLRKEMITAGIDYVFIPDGDFHMSEYISDYFKCREYLSGFDGSNGQLVISETESYLWTDGRYFLQAEEQLEGTGIKLMKMGEPGVPKIAAFLAENAAEGECIGFDGRCVSAAFLDDLKKRLSGKNVKIVPDADLTDRIWNDRPALPSERVWSLDPAVTGMTVGEKLLKTREDMKKAGCDTLVISTLDDIAWLYQFRGNDIEYNPVALSYSVITEDTAILYIEESKVSDIRGELEDAGVVIRDYGVFFDDIKKIKAGSVVMCDRSVSSATLVTAIPEEAKTVDKPSPTVLLKACKTEEEIKGERSAHIDDGAAVTKIIYYLKNNVSKKIAEGERVTELDIADKLLEYRQYSWDFIGQSFAPIVAAGAHGAIIHYEPVPETDAPIEDDSIVLIDTGGHYFRGTTDVTRCVSLGKPTEKMKMLYTAVLKGHLALGSAVFKKGTTGRSLDILARRPLWELGYDYNHGTGHGVGFILNVHEGPQNISSGISKRGDVPFAPGMITSNEPGVYLPGEFGIRIENMIVCREQTVNDFGTFYGFDTLTMVPYERDLIIPTALTEEEKVQIDEYHKMVYNNISSLLKTDERDWLFKATRPI